MKKFLLVLTVLQFLAAAVPATATEKSLVKVYDERIKIKDEKGFCKAWDCSGDFIFARHADPNGKDKEYCGAFNCEDTIFFRHPRAKFVQKKEK
jgi:hypothetical protein